MNKDNDLVPLEINLNAKAEGTLNESWLAMFGGAIETIMAGMFGGSSIPVNVTGTKKQINSFQKALGPGVNKSKAQLDRAIKNFESDTGIVWPFK
jgi:hypothetical protein